MCTLRVYTFLCLIEQKYSFRAHCVTRKDIKVTTALRMVKRR